MAEGAPCSRCIMKTMWESIALGTKSLKRTEWHRLWRENKAVSMMSEVSLNVSYPSSGGTDLPLSASSRWISVVLPPVQVSSSPSLSGRGSADQLGKKKWKEWNITEHRRRCVNIYVSISSLVHACHNTSSPYETGEWHKYLW